jgi:SAM-dependent methyltransferase
VIAPSPWVCRFASQVRSGGSVLDVACGGGRHGRLFLALGCSVVLIDRDVGRVEDLRGHPGAEIIEADLESGAPWPLRGRRFDAVVVVNYLHRPLLPELVASVAENGMLLYETFARGHEHFARPRNPDHLLQAGELLTAVEGRLLVVAYEHGRIEDEPTPGIRQRICAINAPSASAGADGALERFVSLGKAP